MEVGANARMSDLSPGGAIHLVERLLGIASFLAASQGRVQNQVTNRLVVDAGAHALEQQFIHQTGSDDLRRSGRNIAEEIVIDVETEPMTRLQMDSEVTVRDPRPRP